MVVVVDELLEPLKTAVHLVPIGKPDSTKVVVQRVVDVNVSDFDNPAVKYPDVGRSAFCAAHPLDGDGDEDADAENEKLPLPVVIVKLVDVEVFEEPPYTTVH